MAFATQEDGGRLLLRIMADAAQELLFEGDFSPVPRDLGKRLKNGVRLEDGFVVHDSAPACHTACEKCEDKSL